MRVTLRDGWLAENTGRHLNVLLAQRLGNVARGQIERGQSLRVKPDAHAILAQPKQSDVSYAVQTGEHVAYIEKGVVADVGLIVAVFGSKQMHHHQ